ncbi:MAG: CHAT domain-containing protein, partial [Pseudonocardiaceae bacterium]
MADDIVVVLELAEFGNGEFWVKFNSPAIGQTKVRLDGEALVALRARLESVELSVLSSSAQVSRRRAGAPALERPVREFGESLYGAVLRNGVRDAFQQARGIAKHRKQPLRVELRIDSPTLAALPWEFLYDRSNDDYLALAASVTRYQEQLEPVAPLLVPPPLRVLGVVASPDGLAALDVGKERANLEKAIGPLGSDRVNLTWMDGQSADDLRDTLYERSWHVLHFVGHGGFDEEEDEGFLELTDAEGRPDRLFASRLGRYLEDSQSLRLVVLNACESGRTGLDALSGTAATIMRVGVPAVVAMQYEISDPGAITFAKSFYQGLATGRTLDRAVTAARGAMKDANRDTLEWGTPVLYLRSEGARIFDVTTTAPAKAPTKVPPPSASQPKPGPAPGSNIPPSSPIPSTLPSSPLFKRLRLSPDLASKVRGLLTPDPQDRPNETVRAVEAQGATEVCRLSHPSAVYAVLFDPARAALVSG